MDHAQERHGRPREENDDQGTDRSSHYRSMSMSSDSTLSSVSIHSSVSCAFRFRTAERREMSMEGAIGNTGIEEAEQTGDEAMQSLVLNEGGLLTAPVQPQNLVPNVSGSFRQPSLSQNNILQGPVHRDNQRHSPSPNIRNPTGSRNTRVAKVKNSGATPRIVLLPPANQITMTGQADSPDTFSAPETIRYRENLRRYEELQRMEEVLNSGPPVEAEDQSSLPGTPPPPSRGRQQHGQLPFGSSGRQGRGHHEVEALGYRPMVDGDSRPQSAFDFPPTGYQNIHRMRNDRSQNHLHNYNLRPGSRYDQAGIDNPTHASGQNNFTTASLIGDRNLNTSRPDGIQVNTEQRQSSEQLFGELQRNMEAELRMNPAELGGAEGLFSARAQHGHINGHRFVGEVNAPNRAHEGIARDQHPVNGPARQHVFPNILQPAAHIGHLQYLIDLRPCPANAESEAIISRIWNEFLIDCRTQHLLLDDRELLFRVPLPDFGAGPVPEHSRIPIGVIGIWNNAIRNVLDQQPIRLVRDPLYTQIALMFDNPPFMFRSQRPDRPAASTNISDRHTGFQPRPPVSSVMNQPFQQPDSGVGLNGGMWRRQLREVTNNMFPRNQTRYRPSGGLDNTHPGSRTLYPDNPYENEYQFNVANGYYIRNLPNMVHQSHQPSGGAVDPSVYGNLRFHAPSTPEVVHRAPANRNLRNTYSQRAHPYRRPVVAPVAVSTAHHRLGRAVHTPVPQSAMQSPFQTQDEGNNVIPWVTSPIAPSALDSRTQAIAATRQPGPYVHRWLSNVVANPPPVELAPNAGQPVATPSQVAQVPVVDRAGRAQQSTLRPTNGDRLPERHHLDDNWHNTPND
ncbi:hypothetical protein DFP73DRAFT_524846 [Morchella snyderi]|nr:hypothetical protein DFP73DRAFT_524846 [Morchella snyderi]